MLGAATLRSTGGRCRGHSASHRAAANALIEAFDDDFAAIADGLGAPALEQLLVAHRLWSEWLGSGRVRTFAVVAEKR